MCMNMCKDMCIAVCIGMCIDVCMVMCIDLCIGMCADMCQGMYRYDAVPEGMPLVADLSANLGSYVIDPTCATDMCHTHVDGHVPRACA